MVNRCRSAVVKGSLQEKKEEKSKKEGVKHIFLPPIQLLSDAHGPSPMVLNLLLTQYMQMSHVEFQLGHIFMFCH